MPRDRPTQAPQAPNAQAYGMRGDQMAAQRQMPLPQAPNSVPGGPAAGQPGGPDIMALAQQFEPGITPLTNPSERPGEPVTHGLTSGPGAGPEVLAPPTARQHTADLLAAMAATTNDHDLADIALRMRMRGM